MVTSRIDLDSKLAGSRTLAQINEGGNGYALEGSSVYCLKCMWSGVWHASGGKAPVSCRHRNLV